MPFRIAFIFTKTLKKLCTGQNRKGKTYVDWIWKKRKLRNMFQKIHYKFITYQRLCIKSFTTFVPTGHNFFGEMHIFVELIFLREKRIFPSTNIMLKQVFEQKILE